MRIVFDIETTGLDYKANGFRIHCICTHNIDTNESISFHGLTLEDGFKYLQQASLLIGHYIQFFDIPVLEHYFKDKLPGKPFDTKVLSSLMFPELDGHQLKNWGMRLGILKDSYGETADWSVFTPEMLKYCEQDVVVARVLFQHLTNQNWSQQSIDLETEVATIIQSQIDRGVRFDSQKAAVFYTKLIKLRDYKTKELQTIFKPWYSSAGEWTPKKDNATLGYVQGATLTKLDYNIFNPASKDHIANRLIKMNGWKPIKFTPTGKPAVDESVLSELEYKEAKQLAELTIINKVIGMLAEGDNAWLKLVRNDRIHGRVFTTGTVTGRMSHGSPNLAQVPSVDSPYGKECRELFTVSSGKVLVGADASGLELRCLAHFMAKHDDGKYARILLNGDIHTENMRAAGLKDRAQAKKFIYAFLYGAGDEKIGLILGTDAATGRKLKQQFLKKTPALKRLREEVIQASSKGYLFGLDKRKVYVRSEHAALNTLLQSAGALIMKKALTIAYAKRPDLNFVLNVHDEFQVECNEHEAEAIGKLLVKSITEAGEAFNLRCPLNGEYKIGRNWAETH